MQITYYGHSCFLVETKGYRLLFDPFISGNPKAGEVDSRALTADYILLTHGHGDHVGDAEEIGGRCGAPVISNFEIVSWYERKGLKGHPMNHGGKWRFPFGTVKYVYATHSSVLPDGTYGGNPGGFVVWNEEGCLYVAGDTDLTMDMQLIPLTCPPLEVAILPVGDNFTMGYSEAVLAAEFIRCDTIIGCHFDTFPAIVLPRQEATEAFTRKNKRLILPEIGQLVPFR